MVHYQDPQLDQVFSALGDPTRRAILATLMAGECKVSDFPVADRMTLTGLSKHVRVLARAGLISHEKRGRDRICRLQPDALKQAADWVGQYRRYWESQIDRLEVFLAAEGDDE